MYRLRWLFADGRQSLCAFRNKRDLVPIDSTRQAAARQGVLCLHSIGWRRDEFRAPLLPPALRRPQAWRSAPRLAAWHDGLRPNARYRRLLLQACPGWGLLCECAYRSRLYMGRVVRQRLPRATAATNPSGLSATLGCL